MMEKVPSVVRADWIQGPPQGEWTCTDYANITNEQQQRFEVVRGVLYMPPSPDVEHQRISFRIAIHLERFVQQSGLGEVFIAPLDVELNWCTVVQPDVLVILKEHMGRIRQRRIIGAPDLVVEVASPGTVRYDLHEKQSSYAQAGVPEYWIVNPDAHTVEVLSLEDEAYISRGVILHGPLPSLVLPELPVQVQQFFEQTAEK